MINLIFCIDIHNIYFVSIIINYIDHYKKKNIKIYICSIEIHFHEIGFKEASICVCRASISRKRQKSNAPCATLSFRKLPNIRQRFPRRHESPEETPLSRRVGRRGGVFAWVFRGRVVGSLRLARPTGSSLRAF